MVFWTQLEHALKINKEEETMRRFQKTISLVLTLAMMLTMCITAGAADSKDIIVLYTNDVHTHIDAEMGYDTIAAVKQEYAAAGDHVLLVDAGDHIQGTAYGAMDQGLHVIGLMSAAGYDLATLGNHEFDFTLNGTRAAIENAEFPYVSCNLYYRDQLMLDAYKVFTFDGVKVAFVGVTTPESITKSTPAYFQDADGNYIYQISGGTDGAALYADVQKAIDAASKEADYVIGLGHLGDDPTSAPWRAEDVIANTSGMDAFIDGHSHSTIPMKAVADKSGSTVVLTQTGEYLNAIGKMTISADGIKTELIDSYEGSDETVAALADAWMEEVDGMLGRKIAESAIDFTTNGADGKRAVRKYETNMADLNVDAFYWYANEVAGLDCDVAVMNGGGVRASVAAGDWTYKNCKEINPWGNVMCLMEVTGQVLLDALEWGAQASPSGESGGFLMGAGLTYEINANVKSSVQKDDTGIWTGGPADAYRVKNVKIYNKDTGVYEPLDLKKTYSLAGINYTLRNQGDGFNMFIEGQGMKLILDGIAEDYLAFSSYLQAFKDTDGNGYADLASANSPLAAYKGYLLNYESANGGESRFRVLFENPFTDVAESDWFYSSVKYVFDNGVFNGKTATTFVPYAPVTRGQMAAVLYRMSGAEAVETAESFKDVPADSVFADAIAWAAATGITKGYEDGTFRPGQPISRQQFAAFLYRYACSFDYDVSVGEDTNILSFDDIAQVEAYAIPAMQWVVGAGVIQGNTATTLNPTGTAARYQVAVILQRFLETVKRVEAAA